jgi:hypothetical protein
MSTHQIHQSAPKAKRDTMQKHQSPYIVQAKAAQDEAASDCADADEDGVSLAETWEDVRGLSSASHPRPDLPHTPS